MLEQTRIILPNDLVQLFFTLDKNQMLLKQISAEYAMTAQNVLNSPIVMRHETYLDTFPSPKMAKTLLKLYGLDESKIRFIFMKLFSQKRSKGEVNVYTEEGFKSHRMYNNPDYLVHLLTILYVVYKTKNKLDSNEHKELINLLKLAILMIYIVLYNGRVAKYYKFKNADVARYLQKINLPKNFLLRKYPTPLELLLKHYLPEAITYIQKKDLNKHPEDVIYVFSQFWNKLNSLFRRVTNKYMEAHREGKRLTVEDSMNVKTNDEGRELSITEKYTTVRHQINEKVEELSMVITMSSETKVPKGLISKFVVTPYLFEPQELIQIYKGVIQDGNEEQHETLFKEILTYFVNVFKVTNLETLCDKETQLHSAMEKFLKSKRDPHAMKMKRMIDKILSDILELDMDKVRNRMKVSYYRRVYLFILSLFVATTCGRQIKYIDVA